MSPRRTSRQTGNQVTPQRRVHLLQDTCHRSTHLRHESEHARARLQTKPPPQMDQHRPSPSTTDAVTSLPQPGDNEARDSPAPQQPASQHASLKYSLLGPSLTKAGQDSVDQRKVGITCLEALSCLKAAAVTDAPPAAASVGRSLRSYTAPPRAPNISIAKRKETGSLR